MAFNRVDRFVGVSPSNRKDSIKQGCFLSIWGIFMFGVTSLVMFLGAMDEVWVSKIILPIMALVGAGVGGYGLYKVIRNFVSPKGMVSVYYDDAEGEMKLEGRVAGEFVEVTWPFKLELGYQPLQIKINDRQVMRLMWRIEGKNGKSIILDRRVFEDQLPENARKLLPEYYEKVPSYRFGEIEELLSNIHHFKVEQPKEIDMDLWDFSENLWGDLDVMIDYKEVEERGQQDEFGNLN